MATLIGIPLYSPLIDSKDQLVHNSDWIAWFNKINALTTNPAVVPGGALLVANNLSDVASVATSRTNLGLGTGNSPTFTGLLLSGLTASEPVVTDGSKNLASVSYATFASSLGLGSTSTPTFAGLVIDNLTGILRANSGIVGTINIGTSLQYAMTTLNTIQDIRVTATPTWVSTHLTGLTASRLVVTTAGQVLASNGALTTSKLPKAVSSGASLADSSIFDDGASHVGIGTVTPKSAFGVASIDIGTEFSFAVWYEAYSTFGPNVGALTGAALGLGYSTTADAANIVSLAPGVAWKPLHMAAHDFSFVSVGTITGLTQDVNGKVSIATTLALPSLTANELVATNASKVLVNVPFVGTNNVLHDGTPPVFSKVVEDDISLGAVTTNDATAARHGFLPTLSNISTQFLNGQGVFTSVSSGAAAGYRSQSFTLQTSVTVTHNLNGYPVVQIIGTSNSFTITHNSLNDFTVAFDVAASGIILYTLGAPPDPIINTQVADYSMTDNDETIVSNGALTITLLSAIGRAGRLIRIKRIYGGGYTKVASVLGQTFDGQPSPLILTSQWDAAVLKSDGANWELF